MHCWSLVGFNFLSHCGSLASSTSCWRGCKSRGFPEFCAPGCESRGLQSMHQVFHLSLIGQHWWVLLSACWSFCLFVWLLFVLLSLIVDQSLRSSYLPMTILAQLRDCHSCYDERSIDKKKSSLHGYCNTAAASATWHTPVPILSQMQAIRLMNELWDPLDAKWISMDTHQAVSGLGCT